MNQDQDPMDAAAETAQPTSSPSAIPEFDQEPASQPSEIETSTSQQSTAAADLSAINAASVEPAPVPTSWSSDSGIVQPDSVQPAAPSQPEAQKPKSKRLVVWAIIAAILVALLGGGSALYAFWYQNPDRVVHEAIMNFASAKNIRTQTTVTSDSELAPGFINLKLKNLKVTSAGSAETMAGDGELSLAIELNGRDYTVGAMGRFTDSQTVYFQLLDIKDLVLKLADDLGGSQQITPEIKKALESMQNRWVKVDLEDVLDDTEAETFRCVIDTTKRLVNDPQYTDRYADLYRDNKFLVVGESLGSKDGSLGYRVDVDQDKLQSYLKAGADANLSDEYSKCPGYEESTFNEDDLTGDFDDLKNDKVDIKAVVWVSRFGHELRQLDYELAIKSPTEKDIQFSGETKFTYDAVKVEAPADAVELEAWQKEIETLSQKAVESVYGPTTQPDEFSLQQIET